MHQSSLKTITQNLFLRNPLYPPSILKKLLTQGLPIEVIPAQTIDELLEERKENALLKDIE